MEKILVFCGSSHGNKEQYINQAEILGHALANRDIELIYGGTKIGLMGKLADAVLQDGGRATGVLPHFLKAKEIAHPGLTSLLLVDTLQQRKTKMSELSDGVITLPGGFGTLDELFEMLTWCQLGLQMKPVGLLNIDGYYDPLLAMIDTMVEAGFLKKSHAGFLLVASEVEKLLEKMEAYAAPSETKWM